METGANGFMGRRDFVQGMMALLAAVQGMAVAGVARGQAATPAARGGTGGSGGTVAPRDNLVGVQMGPHTLLDEGIEHAMDLCQETAAINTLVIYSHAYGGDLRKQLNVLATDHGVPVKD